MNNSRLRLPTAYDLRWLRDQDTSSLVSAHDLPDWQDVLKNGDVLLRMEKERQTRNDCQGNAAANGEEARTYRLTRTMPVLSEMYAYIASLYLMSPRYVGNDSGSSMHSGARLLLEGVPDLGLEPGLCTDEEWRPNVWCRTAKEFSDRASRISIIPSLVGKISKPPRFVDLLAKIAAGSTLHVGTYWSVRWSTLEGLRLMNRAPTRGGGHATEGIWAKYINNEWYLAVWNSHGYGPYLMSEACYETLRQKNFYPFGAFVLEPRDIVEKYDRLISGGGYI